MSRSRMNSKVLFILIAVAGVLMIVTYLALSPESKEKKRARMALELEEQRHLGGKNDASGPAYDLRELRQVAENSPTAEPEVMLAQAHLYYRYPPESRPLTRRMEDLLNPYRVPAAKSPLVSRDELQGPPKYLYSWSTESFIAAPGTPVIYYLTVYDATTQKAVPIQIRTSVIRADAEFGGGQIGLVSNNDAGLAGDTKAGDQTYTFSWQPQAGKRIHWGDLTLEASFVTPDGKTREVSAHVSSTPHIPAEFTGDFREALVDGSLVIYARMRVKKAGQYFVQANLFGTDGEPYHWVFVRPYLEAGVQEVKLVFFGIAFHDRNFSGGKLVLTHLRAVRNNVPYDPRKLDHMLETGQTVPTTSEPLEERVPLLRRDYVTQRSYEPDQFSRKEYDGPDKRERLAFIRKIKAEDPGRGAASE